MKDLKERAVRGGLARLCGQATNVALRLGFMATMARLLNPEDFGLVAMVTVVTGVFEIFATAGLSMATVQKATITDEQLSTLFWINLLVGLVLCLLCLVTAPLLVSFYHEPRLSSIAAAMGAWFVLSAGGVQHSALLQRQLRYVALAAAETLSLLGSFALGIALALSGFGYWALVAATIAAPAINTAATWVITAWVPGMPRRSAEILSMLRFGGTITLTNLVVYVGYNFEKLLLGRFWGADALGLYGRAYQLNNVPTTNLHSAVGGVVFSALSRVQDDRDRLRAYFLKSYSLVISLTVPVSVFGAVFADEIVLVVFGPKWMEAATIFRLLAPTVLVLGIINPTGWLLQSIGLQGRSLKIAYVIAPLLVAASLIALPYGPRGVAFAYSAAMALWLVPHMMWALHGTMISPWDIVLATSRPLFASLVAAALAFGVELYVGDLRSPFLLLAVVGTIMMSLYTLMLLFIMGQKSFYVDLLWELRRPRGSVPNPQ